VFETNDPLAQVIEVPARLTVAAAPDIVLSDTLLDYGAVFIGGVATHTLTVSNLGKDLLTVEFRPPRKTDFAVGVSTLNVAPGESQAVAVSFAPATVGASAGTLAVRSNDHEQKTLTVALLGQGLLPPVIRVLPDAVGDSLFTGQSSKHTLTIDNSAGGGDLTFQMVILDTPAGVPAAAAQPRDVSAAHLPEVRLRAAPMMALTPTGTGTAPRQPAHAETAGPPQAAHAETGMAPRQPAHAGTAGPPQPFGGQAVTPGGPAAIVLQDDFEDGDFDGWIIAGAGLKEVTSATAAAATVYSYHDSNSTFGHFDGIFQRLGAVQPAYIGFYIRSSSVRADDSYFVLRDQFGTEVIWFYAQRSGGFYINADVGGHDTYPYNADTWYHIELKDISFATKTFDYYVDGTLVLAGISLRNAPIVNDVFRLDIYSFDSSAEAWWDEIWISNGALPVGWARGTPLVGTVPAGASLDADITLDAAGLAGDFEASIVLVSNDPLSPELAVPVRLHVIPSADIALSDSVLEYGIVFIGGSATDTLTVLNVGADTLHVTSLSTDARLYTVDVTGFNLEVGGSRVVLVTFAPSNVGDITATLTIESDDPDESVVTVSLRGTGALPPVISVSPDSLHEHLSSGSVSKQLLTIDNSAGANPLEFIIAITDADSTAQRIPKIVTIDLGKPENYRVLDVLGIPYTRVSPAAFAGTNLNEFDLLYVGRTSGGANPAGMQALVNKKTEIAAFVAAGGGLVALSENGDNALDWRWLPFDAGFLGVDRNVVNIVNPSHPVMASLTSADLSNWNNGVHNVFTRFPPGLEPVAVVPTSGAAAILAGTVTGGRVVLCGLDPDWHLFVRGGPASAGVLLGNALNWVSEAPGWISANPLAGTIAAGASMKVEVTFDATGLSDGDYRAQLGIASNDPLTTEVTIPAHLVVSSTAVTTVLANDLPNIPRQFALHQNYPNPLNPTTTIAYDLPHAVETRLVIYNVRGERVRELVSEYQQPGRYKVPWNGRNASGDAVASGVYFYKLRAGTFVRTRKLVVLK
ncbi:MAG: choice-of-anchor D domain-containing protein, partial [Candidatus Krumholzibacteria bacterium]